MPAKISTHVFKGMQKDINVANSSNEYFFDAHNIRLNLLDDDTLMSIVNERGNECILESGIEGLYVSHYVVGKYIVVFTYDETNEVNIIYRIDVDEPNVTVHTLFDESDLNIRPEKPLEFTSYFEAEDVIKIYWVDGVNQLRFMNIMVDEPYTDPNDFNTTPELKLEETVTVELIDGNGLFPAGVIQYALTYVNKLGAESNIFYTTKLHSILFKNRAAGPQEYVNCAFRITINNVDTSFDYIRCYQLLRTSLDAQPTCLILNEISANSETITIYDNNIGATYDPTALLFLKYPIIPYTLDLKSNTLFLGNLDEEVFELSDNDIATVRTYFNQEVEYTSDDIISVESNKQAGTYPVLRFGNANLETYECEENNGYIFNPNCDIIRTFKSRETYRIGVLLLNEFGVWSEPIYLKDIDVESKQQQSNNIVNPISLIFDGVRAGALTLNENYKRFRFLMVNPSATDRSIFTLGIVVPTIYELSDRVGNAPFSYSSWFLRSFNSGIACNHNEHIPAEQQTQAELLAEIRTNLNDKWFTTTPTYNNSEVSVSDIDEFPNVPLKVNIGLAFYRIEPMIVQVEMNLTLSKPGVVIKYSPLSNKYVCRLYMSADTITEYLAGGKFEDVYNNVMSNFSSISSYDEHLPTIPLSEYILRADDHDLHGPRNKDNNYLYNNVYVQLLNLNIVLPAYNTTPNIYNFSVTAPNSGGIDLTDYMVPNSEALNPVSTVVSKPGTMCDFYVDHSILNLYSPEINDNYYILDNNKLRLDLVGYSVINDLLYNINIELLNSGADPHSHLLNTDNYHYSWHGKFSPKLTDFLFNDTAVVKKKDDDGKVEVSYTQVEDNNDQPGYVSYAIYPWHRSTALNNDININNGEASALYTRKVFAKSWIGNNTNYFNIPYQYDNTSRCENGILKVCNNTTSMILFKLNGNQRMYIPNVDIARTFIDHEYDIHIDRTQPFDTLSDIIGLDKPYHIKNSSDYESILTSDDPILIKYNSAEHVVIPVEYKLVTDYDGTNWYYNTYQLYTLPTLSVIDSYIYRYYPLWDNFTHYVSRTQHIVENGNNVICENNYLFIGEFYRDVSNTRYGGPIVFEDEYDRENPILINNIFIPITESYSINTIDTNVITTTYGDTWYGRWDCLKTLEMTDLDLLSIHDYASVMIESHINLNGRYDSYRNFYDLTLVNALNANKFNDVYNQMDTFWSYKVVPNYLKTTYYPNQVTWSLTKLTGALVDEWTKVTAANVQELDGNKGPINKILNYRDSLFVFQDRCISLIKYNEQTQMTTTEGVPVEISNSQKVTGVVKIYDGTGCVNKWSIASDANGIFFVDNVNECIIWLGGSLDTPIVNLTSSKAFALFMKANNSFTVWNPESFSNFVTFIDSAHKDVYFVNEDKCLCFSLALLEFTSFYDYLRTYGMFNINNNFYSLYTSLDEEDELYNVLTLYRNFTGKYNEIYGKLVETSFTFIDHGESFLMDKTFTNINYILDAYDVSLNASDTIEDYDNVDYKYEPEVTFNTLRVWTPFLDTGDVKLTPNEDLQRKFRTWGILILRDLKYNNTSVDRIRNNWAKFKFIFTLPDYNEDGTVKQGVTNPRDIKIELMNINILSIE